MRVLTEKPKRKWFQFMWLVQNRYKPVALGNNTPDLCHCSWEENHQAYSPFRKPRMEFVLMQEWYNIPQTFKKKSIHPHFHNAFLDIFLLAFICAMITLLWFELLLFHCSSCSSQDLPLCSQTTHTHTAKKNYPVHGTLFPCHPVVPVELNSHKTGAMK